MKKVNLENFNLILKKTWISTFQWEKAPKSFEPRTGYIYLLGQDDINLVQKIISKNAIPRQIEELKKQNRDLIYFQGAQGPVWICRPREKSHSTEGAFSAESSYALARDMFGSLVSQMRAHQLEQVQFEINSADESMLRGSLVGLELGAYSFKGEMGLNSNSNIKVFIKLINTQLSSKSRNQNLLASCGAEAAAINAARHWVNLPPNFLNPEAAEKVIRKIKWGRGMKLSVWDGPALKKQKMNLLLAVGQGSESGPRFVHLQYRPVKKSKLKSIAFVGKGITFDTGGLDIKPSSAMRLMKKDMGGAAAVLALATWVSEVQYPRACDFYLCFAENSVDGKSFRPSDLIQSRAGHWVEIDNTDAEGRLVLADGLDVAVQQKEPPEYVIDVATLTGAIKVALGAEVAGLFSNDDKLGSEIFAAGKKSGDYNWQMPLVDRYFSSLSSVFADFKNSADGFGGAITAALFLQKFVKQTKWAHLDIYAWSDKAQGALSSAGGNGQAVQCLIEFLKTKSK